MYSQFQISRGKLSNYHECVLYLQVTVQPDGTVSYTTTEPDVTSFDIESESGPFDATDLDVKACVQTVGKYYIFSDNQQIVTLVEAYALCTCVSYVIYVALLLHAFFDERPRGVIAISSL